jgi:hypothetical protein
MRTIYIFLLFILSSLVTQAQFKGIWNGYIDDNEGSGTSGYLINITDEGDGVVSGETYIYGNSILKFLGKLDFIGTIEGNGIKIMELKLLINRKPSPIHFICFKDLDLKLTKKDSVSSLIGPWLGDIVNDVQCIPGTAYLYKMNKDSTCAVPIPKYVLDFLNNKRKVDLFLNTELSSPYLIKVKSRLLDVKLIDYDLNDRDIVSVYLNRSLVADRVRIKPKPTVVSVRLNPFIFIQEMIVYAHNLGKIPPNTCMLEVDDGFSVQQVYISSSFQKSALVYFKYEDPQ